MATFDIRPRSLGGIRRAFRMGAPPLRLGRANARAVATHRMRSDCCGSALVSRRASLQGMRSRGRSGRIAGDMKTKTTLHHGRGVNDFLAAHGDKVTGVISGFDRLRLQGTLRALYMPEVFQEYLWRAKVLCKDYKAHLSAVSARICDRAEAIARRAGLGVRYVRSAATRKEELVAETLREHPRHEGLVAVLSSVEPCRTWKMRGNYQTKRLEPRLEWGQCLHLYFYFVHRELGLMHLRLQTWFPFLVHVVLNGREWLCRQLDRAGVGYLRADNCLPWIEDSARAQALLDAQAKTRWPALLDPLVTRFHPQHQRLHDLLPVDYYWTVAQSEYATDVMFRDRAALQSVYPRLVHHGIMHLGTTDVLRFLGRCHPGQSEVQTSRLTREEGTRLKHWVDGNSLKLYDKGSVLRAENTINHPEECKVWRASERDTRGPKAWRPLRRSVADLPRRADVGRAATDRYFGALAAVEHGTPLAESAATVCRSIVRKGRRHRALNPFAPDDTALLAVVNDADFTLRGLRNRDVRERLYPRAPASLTARQLSSRISRQLALLRAHGLIARVSKTHRYVVTKKGRIVLTTLLAAAHANTEQLTKLAA